jgi:hypothetical protein
MNRFNQLIEKLINNIVTGQELDELREIINDDTNIEEMKAVLDALFELPCTEAEGLTRLEYLYMIEYMNTLSFPKDFNKRKFPLTD